MKKFFVIAALAAAAFAVSCQPKDAIIDSVEESGINKTPVSHIFTCEFAAADTRFGLVGEGANVGKTTWEEGDEIMIHGGADGHDRLLVTLGADDIIDGGKKAIIDIGELEPYDRTTDGILSGYYAQYPASLVPDGNMYYECRFTATNAPLMAACNVDDAFVFYNLCGIISFRVDGNFDSFKFSGNNGETVGYETVYQVRVRNDEGGMVINYNKPGNESGTPVPMKAYAGAVVADGETLNYVYLPAGTDFSGGFTFKFYNGDELTKVATSYSEVNVKVNKILALGDITDKLEDYVAPTESDHTPAFDGDDLSFVVGPANCYIITEPGAYKFPVVKGNSDEEAGKIFDVELVWETYNNAESVTANSVIEEVDFSGPENYVYFKTPDTLKPGNALIAAKDIDDNIIWSWHIWIPATTIEVGDYGIHKTEMMDRNLGALVVAEASDTEVIDITSIGLFYQWGRKDPFVGPREILEGDYPSKAKVSGTERTYDKVQVTVAESIQKPTFFARGYYNNGTQEDPNWCSEPDPSFWGDGADKTIYDPCPAGYRVPNREKSYALWADSVSDADGLEYDAAHYWIKLGTTVFPAVGWIDGGSIKTTLRMGVWNSHSDSWTNDYGFSHYAGYARRFYLDSGTFKQKNSSVSKSLGYSVRCVAE